ncbi:hypothetical protein LTR28_002736, partial [Elasticomyces elasticus]
MSSAAYLNRILAPAPPRDMPFAPKRADDPGGAGRQNARDAALPPKVKRQLIAAACSACRRCDGGRPACSVCVRKQSECSYDVAADETRTAALKRKNNDLESELQSLRRNSVTRRRSSPPPHHPPSSPITPRSSSVLRQRNTALESELIDLRDLFSFLQSRPDIEAQEILVRIRNREDVLSVLRTVREADLLIQPRRCAGDEYHCHTLPSIQALVLDVRAGSRDGSHVIAILQDVLRRFLSVPDPLDP